ncbi:MAG: DUF2177 family protein [Legionellaceae bacterium]|nr:DUF2177 family protein [Legionellaceae bacterium]
MNYIKLFIISMLVFFMLDMSWIGYIAKAMYFKSYANWLRLENGRLLPIWWAMIIIYALFAFATLTFVLPLSKGLLWNAFFYGAALGLVIYGVYDFTCLAIFKNWPVMMAFVDCLWGIILCSISATITVYLSRFI